MLAPVHLILLVFSLCCFAFSAYDIGSPSWQRVISLGLTFLVASFLFVSGWK